MLLYKDFDRGVHESSRGGSSPRMIAGRIPFTVPRSTHHALDELLSIYPIDPCDTILLEASGHLNLLLDTSNGYDNNIDQELVLGRVATELINVFFF